MSRSPSVEPVSTGRDRDGLDDDDMIYASFRRGREPPRMLDDYPRRPPPPPRDPNAMRDVGIKDLLNIEFNDAVPDSNVRFPWTGDFRRKAEERRAKRPEGSLMIDRMMRDYQQRRHHSYPPEHHSDVAEYIKDTKEENRNSETPTIYYLLLDMVHQGKDTVSFEDRSNPAEQYARNYSLSQTIINRTRGYWTLDHDLIELGVYHLSLPSPPVAWNDRQSYNDEVVFTLSHLGNNGNKVASKWLQRYIDFVKYTLKTPDLRNAYVQALAEHDFARAWEWVRNWEFESHLEKEVRVRNRTPLSPNWHLSDYGREMDGLPPRLSKEEKLAAKMADLAERDLEAERLERIAAERERLLVVLLSKILKPMAMRKPLEALMTAPIDTFEEGILTAYLLDPETGLSQQSFDVLHDLLTTRLLSHGRYSNAIDLDARVTELVRSSNREIANPRVKRERRQMVDDMISLLPRVQRELLAAEKDFNDRSAQEDTMTWAAASISTTAVQTRTTDEGTSVRTTKRVVSLSGLISASPRRTGDASANLYQAILQNQANSIRAREEVPAPPSPANRMHASVSEYRSPRPITQPRAQSPFSSPVKVPRYGGPRMDAPAASSSRFSFRSPLLPRAEAVIDGETGSAMEEDEAESTPIPAPRKSSRRTGRSSPPARGRSVEADEHDNLAMDVDNDQVDVQQLQTPSPEPEETPVKPKRARKQPADLGRSQGPSGSRYETRTRQASATQSREPSIEPTPAVEPVPAPKAAKRARTKPAPPLELSVEVPTITPPRRTRKKPASTVPDEPEAEAEPTPAAKRARRATAATPSHPPVAKRTARQTRSQSVMSEATTEGGDESSQARALRRSGRLSSVAPVSPDKSETGGVRTRRAASRQPSEAPAMPTPARPRRTAARK